MNIITFNPRQVNSDLSKDLLELFKAQALVPIIGSGFTKGIHTKNAQVPSSDEFKHEMLYYIKKYKNYDSSFWSWKTALKTT